MKMEIVRGHRALTRRLKAPVIAIGNFDGVHRGHAYLFRETRRLAAATGESVVLTFDPHPQKLLRPDFYQPVLTAISARAELLQAHGVDQVAVLQTTPALLQLTANEFFDRLVVKALSAKSQQPVAYAELPGAQHAFEIFPSVRTLHTVNAVHRFLAWLESGWRRERVGSEGRDAA